jgi:50S ribosomal protein L16 3-hydroxylase
MVSYSVPGAGVGAHIDQYDVFLIQGKGSRQWQVGKPNNQAEFDNQGLLQVDDFEPCIDVVVKPGDVLYIPPGWPHKGETVEAALTYSVGFRAPDTEFIAGALQDFLIQQPAYNQRFSDPKPNYKGHFAQISSTAIEQLKQMLSDCMSSPQFSQHLTAALSQQNLTDEAQEIAEISKQEILDAMQNGDFLHRREGLRPLFSEIDHGDHWLYLDGEAIKIGAMMWPIVLPLVEFTSIQLTDDLPEDMLDPYAALVQFLVERQWWYLED